MYYPMRYPFAKFFQHFGVTLIVRIDVIFDAEAKVYVATSKDISGLVLEAETFQSLESEVREAIINLAKFDTTIPTKTNADLIYRDHIAIA